ncbi:MAG: outer membrane beta-barrel protein [Chitinophagaceae bacterium]
MYHLLRKQILLLLIGCCISSFVFSQFEKGEVYREEHDDKPYYFGMTLGYASTYLAHSKTPRFLANDSVLSIEPGFSPSFALGLMATLHPYNRWEFRINPQLILGISRSFRYRLNPPDPAQGEDSIEKRNVQSTVISFPLSVKFNSDRIHNFRIYMMGGVQMDLDLASNAAARNAEQLLKLKKFDYGVHCGIGFNFFLPFVTVSPEIKFVWGMADLHSRSPDLKFSNNLDKLQSRMIMFSLHLEE